MRSYWDFYPDGDSTRSKLVKTKESGQGLTALALFGIIAVVIVTAWFIFWPVGQ